jgi:hypothetical protein
MALSDTGAAIGSVSRLLKDVLTNALTSASPSPNVTISRPEPASSGAPPSGARLNLFLYEVQLDASLRNVSLTPGRQSPLWLVLHYLMTAFDESGDSDTDGAHDILGFGMQVLLGMNNSGVLETLTDKSLLDNPESLKVTFDEGAPDLLSRLMQGPDDRFRMSVPFQIRPVLVADSEPPASLQLVGINYLTNTTIGLAGVKNTVLPSLGPIISAVTPAQVQPGDSLQVLGTGFGSGQVQIRLGNAVNLAVTTQKSGLLTCTVGGAALDPTRLSAGGQSVVVVQTIAPGKTLSSNALSTSLLPLVTGVAAVGLQPVSGTNPKVYGSLKLQGQFLGRSMDYVEVGLLDSSGVVVMIDRRDPGFAPPADQTAQQLLMQPSEAVPPGNYTVVIRVNGAQARQAFQLNMV